jgi:hypothetical protein
MVWVGGKLLDTSQPKAAKWKPPVVEKKKFGECPDCGAIIWEMEPIWWMHDRIVCLSCCQPYYEAGLGHHDAAGLVLPGMALEG